MDCSTPSTLSFTTSQSLLKGMSIESVMLLTGYIGILLNDKKELLMQLQHTPILR